MSDSTQDTLEHINKVRVRLHEVIYRLHHRSLAHDASKLEEPEKSGYDQLQTRLQDVQYGTDAYRVALVEAGETIAHHYAHNSHHPEHYENGVEGMSLLDLVEMVCDWKAASERTKNGSLAQSLAHNVERFKLSPQLTAIIENTRRELGWE